MIERGCETWSDRHYCRVETRTLAAVRLWSDRSGQILSRTHVVFVQGEVVRGQHSDSQARAQRGVQEAAQDRLILQRQKKTKQEVTERQTHFNFQKWVVSRCVADVCLSPGGVCDTPWSPEPTWWPRLCGRPATAAPVYRTGPPRPDPWSANRDVHLNFMLKTHIICLQDAQSFESNVQLKKFKKHVFPISAPSIPGTDISQWEHSRPLRNHQECLFKSETIHGRLLQIHQLITI